MAVDEIPTSLVSEARLSNKTHETKSGLSNEDEEALQAQYAYIMGHQIRLRLSAEQAAYRDEILVLVKDRQERGEFVDIPMASSSALLLPSDGVPERSVFVVMPLSKDAIRVFLLKDSDLLAHCPAGKAVRWLETLPICVIPQ